MYVCICTGNTNTGELRYIHVVGVSLGTRIIIKFSSMDHLHNHSQHCSHREVVFDHLMKKQYIHLNYPGIQYALLEYVTV